MVLGILGFWGVSIIFIRARESFEQRAHLLSVSRSRNWSIPYRISQNMKRGKGGAFCGKLHTMTHIVSLFFLFLHAHTQEKFGGFLQKKNGSSFWGFAQQWVGKSSSQSRLSFFPKFFFFNSCNLVSSLQQANLYIFLSYFAEMSLLQYMIDWQVMGLAASLPCKPLFSQLKKWHLV